MSFVATDAINFVRKRQRTTAKMAVFDRWFLWVGIGVFSVGVIALIALIIFWQYLRSQLQSVQAQKVVVERELGQAARDQAAYLLYTEQLNSIQEVLSGRGSKKQALAFVGDLLQPKISFDRITYHDSDQTLSFRVQTDNVFVLETFLQALRSPKLLEQTTDIKMSDIRRAATGGYTIEILTILKEKS